MIVNQTNMDNKTIKIIDGNGTNIINISNTGVSNNRNYLLRFAGGDICTCINDNCSLVDRYSEIVEDGYKKHADAEPIF